MADLVSVIMPVYNRENTVDQALESITAQTYKNIEIIVVDDGSDDRTYEILGKYSRDLRLHVKNISHTGNIALVRNVGYALSQGQFIAVMDSDDICKPDRIEKQVAFLKAHPDVHILATWVEIIGDNKNEQAVKLLETYNRDNNRAAIINAMLNEGSCLCNSTVIMKRTALELLGGYDEDFRISEDYNMWMEAFLKGLNIYILNEVTLMRRLHNNAVTSQFAGAQNVRFNIIRIKLKYLIVTGILKGQKITVFGINSRNAILDKVMKQYYNGVFHLQYEIILPN